MPTQLNTDVALGVAIPSRNARGRIARLTSVVDAVLSSHKYPPPIEKLMAEALVLTALFGSLLKEAEGQVTLQAQTENGIVDLMVCDYLARRAARLHPPRPRTAGRTPARTRRCSRCSARAIWRSPSTIR